MQPGSTATTRIALKVALLYRVRVSPKATTPGTGLFPGAFPGPSRAAGAAAEAGAEAGAAAATWSMVNWIAAMVSPLRQTLRRGTFLVAILLFLSMTPGKGCGAALIAPHP